MGGERWNAPGPGAVRRSFAGRVEPARRSRLGARRLGRSRALDGRCPSGGGPFARGPGQGRPAFRARRRSPARRMARDRAQPRRSGRNGAGPTFPRCGHGGAGRDGAAPLPLCPSPAWFLPRRTARAGRTAGASVRRRPGQRRSSPPAQSSPPPADPTARIGLQPGPSRRPCPNGGHPRRRRRRALTHGRRCERRGATRGDAPPASGLDDPAGTGGGPRCAAGPAALPRSVRRQPRRRGAGAGAGGGRIRTGDVERRGQLPRSRGRTSPCTRVRRHRRVQLGSACRVRCRGRTGASRRPMPGPASPVPPGDSSWSPPWSAAASRFARPSWATGLPSGPDQSSCETPCRKQGFHAGSASSGQSSWSVPRLRRCPRCAWRRGHVQPDRMPWR